MSHRLKKIGEKSGLKVLFSAPDKLQRLCKAINLLKSRATVCPTKHKTRFGTCEAGVVYLIPLPCGKRYIGQTGHCLNERLKEHHYNAHKSIQGHIGIPCRDCGCSSGFYQCEVVKKHPLQITREIIEAHCIARA